MKHLSIRIAFSFLITLPAFSQESLPYYCDFNENTQAALWEVYNLGDNTDDLFYTWNFQIDNLAHSYPVGGTEITDNWAVSPSFDFSNGATIDSISHAFSGFGMPFGLDTIMIYAIAGSSNPDLATEVIPLKLLSGDDYNPDNVWRKSTGINIPPMEGESHIAFRYKTIVNWLDVRLDDLYISGNPLSDEIIASVPTFEVFPNPAKDFILFQSIPPKSTVRIMNIAGQTVFEAQSATSQFRVDVQPLASGLYILNVEGENNAKMTQKLVISD